MSPLEIIGYAGYVVGAVIILASKTKSDNLKDLKERVEILEKERDYAKAEHLENQRAIKYLEGQLDTYKEIPLKSIAHSLESLPSLVKSNEEILNSIKNSATLLAKEKKRPRKQHIETQIVDEQIIGG
jgi:hypothetical protein